MYVYVYEFSNHGNYLTTNATCWFIKKHHNRQCHIACVAGKKKAAVVLTHGAPSNESDDNSAAGSGGGDGGAFAPPAFAIEESEEGCPGYEVGIG